MLAFRSIDDTIKLWDTLTNQEIITLTGHTDFISALCFSPTIWEGPFVNILASGSYDNTIKLWDTSTNKEITTLLGHIELITSICFSPCSTKILYGDKNF